MLKLIKKEDVILSFAVVFQLVVTTFQLLLPMLHITGTENAAQLRVIITAATFIPAIWIVFKRDWMRLLIPFAIYLFVRMINILLFPASDEFIHSSDALLLTPISILIVIIFVSIRDFGEFEKVLLFISRICPLISLLFVLASRFFPQTEEFLSYSMSFGYSFLLPALYLFMQKNIWDKLGSIVLFIAILLVGSRGPFVVLVLFVIYYMLFAKKVKMKLVPTILIVAAGVFFIYHFSNSDIFESSRTFKMFNSGELISHDSGRDELQIVVKRKIEENPIVGWGVGSDRHFAGFYCHNIFLEIFCHYGIIAGGVFFLFLFCFVLRMYYRPRSLTNAGGREFFVLMFLFGFVPMIVSGSYLTNFKFAFYMGYLIWVHRNSQQIAKLNKCRHY